jgi:hypothetical protein
VGHARHAIVCFRSAIVEELFAILGLFTTPLVIAMGVSMYYTRKELNRLRRDDSPTVRDDHRLDRLEQAVDAIAVEVERLAQGQQYTARLLADRAERSVPPSGGH